MISPGASITEGQPVMELETDKAVVEVPSSVTGTIQEIRVKEGEKIKVGQVIFTFENGASAKAKTAEAPAPKAETPTPAPAAPKETAQPQAAPEARPTGDRRAAASVSASEFKLPELGENITQGDLVRLMVAPGTRVSEGQPVMELETDKAVIEVPSSVSGIVKEVKVKEGEKIKVGQVIFTLEGGAPAQSEIKRARNAPVEHVSGQHGARLAFQAAIRAEGKTEEQALPPDQPQLAPAAFSMPLQLGKVAGTEHRQPVPAAPHVRRFAREVGVDIYEVKGSGPGGRISEDDIKAYAKALLSAAATAAQAPPLAGHFAQPKLPDFGKWGK